MSANDNLYSQYIQRKED